MDELWSIRSTCLTCTLLGEVGRVAIGIYQDAVLA